MEHSLFLILNLALSIGLIWYDRINVRGYVALIVVGLIAAFIFENMTISMGFWSYHSEPKLLLISLYTWLLYIPYLSFCYFLGNRLVRFK